MTNRQDAGLSSGGCTLGIDSCKVKLLGVPSVQFFLVMKQDSTMDLEHIQGTEVP